MARYRGTRGQRNRGRKKNPSISEKVEYVKSQGQAREYHCHGGMPGCKGQCPPAMWGC